MTFEDGEIGPGDDGDAARGSLSGRELRTGLIVEVPAAEALVDRHRQRMDPMARLGVPAHITVLFPFVPTTYIDETVTTVVESVAAKHDRFSFELSHVGWFGDEVLWLAPTATDQFVRLTRALCEEFPAYQPYGGQFTDLVPHLTVADRAPAEAMHRAELQIRDELPISCEAGSVVLMSEQATGRWSRSASYPLR